MKKLLVSLLILTFILTLLTGCKILEHFKKNPRNDVSDGDDTQTVSSDISGLSLKVPKNWNIWAAEYPMSISTSESVKGQSLVVVENELINNGVDFDFDSYIIPVIEGYKINLESTDNPLIYTTTIGDGIDAWQYEMEGKYGNIKFKYLMTFVKIENVLYHFITWCYLSFYDESKPVFDSILDSVTFSNLSHT